MQGFGSHGEFAHGETQTQLPPFVGFTQFSQPLPRRSNNPALTSFQPFPLLVQQSTPFSFTPFSQPRPAKLNPALQAWQPLPLLEPTPPPPTDIPFTGFTQFSQPRPAKRNAELTSFQPLPLLAPQMPFMNFTAFSQPLPKKNLIPLLAWQPFTLLEKPPDRRDGVFVKRKRPPQRDLIQDELDEKARRRAAIALAVYGPEIVYEPPPVPVPPQPPNVLELAQIIMRARDAERQALQQALEQDDEDVIELILKDL